MNYYSIILVFAFMLIPITTVFAEEACADCTIEDVRATANEMLEDDIPVSIWTDRTDYDHNDVILVEGQVAVISSGFPVTVTVISPQNSIVTIDQLSLNDDGSFEIVYNTSGTMWKYDGTYTIKANYGSAEKSNSTKVQLSGGVAFEPNYSTPESTKKIPDWVKNIFLWYGQDKISETELLSALQFLIREGTLRVD